MTGSAAHPDWTVRYPYRGAHAAEEPAVAKLDGITLERSG